MSLNKAFLFIILLLLLSSISNKTITSPSYYSYDYSIGITIEPNSWRLAIDIYNTNFILYYPPEDRYYTWPKNLLDYSDNLTEGNNVQIQVYNKPIEAKEYFVPANIEGCKFNFTLYYTENSCPDERSYYSIERNIRQLSIGFGLDVKPNQEQSSLIHSLYNHQAIDSKTFSFEHKRDYIGKAITKNIRFGSVGQSLLNSYEYNFTSYVDAYHYKWGILFDSICIGNKTLIKVNMNVFAPLNSALNTTIRSYEVYEAFKLFLTKEHSYLKSHCKEVNEYDTVCIRCSGVSEGDLGETVNVYVEGIKEIKIPLKYFCVWENESSCLMSGVYYDVKDEQHEVQFGKGFLFLFDLIEFDYEQRKIAFYSHTLEIENIRNKFYIKSKMLFSVGYLMMILGVVNNLIWFIKPIH